MQDLTDGHEPACELDGARQVSHLVNRVAEVVQDVHLGNRGFLSGIQLLQGLLHPQHGVVVVGVVVRRLTHVVAVVHRQQGVGVETWRRASLTLKHWLHRAIPQNHVARLLFLIQ